MPMNGRTDGASRSRIEIDKRAQWFINWTKFCSFTMLWCVFASVAVALVIYVYFWFSNIPAFIVCWIVVGWLSAILHSIVDIDPLCASGNRPPPAYTYYMPSILFGPLSFALAEWRLLHCICTK